ncbi:c-type cytochrome [Wenxinia saemankumensis]|uniref:Cytochrome C oxidase, cbb3-type, subunit III n=1 Tax=Wenxinia saemankumensis TaxID=1447782 RepID=A0A1M6HBV6_9RHOB|nr:c-type cytochrome [Wenxinia saemankumensis]SHJ19636.1 Cytochrome C oxidase, cbb3-type, subunit III [Wenxinia saemankumensis]
MRTVFKTLAALAVLGALAGGAVVFGGLYNVSARAGHFPGVPWILHTTFRRSVALRAPDPADTPELTDEMAMLGRNHFENACSQCHAAPGATRDATIRSMLPEPPHIEAAVGSWSPEELWWILHEGVKMSGMPHWPSIRDDDVWPVVAFLVRVQDGMDAQAYGEMVAGDEYCAACHGPGGASDNPHIPRLDILSERYVAMSLRTYREGLRESGIMRHAATEVTAPEGDLAAEYHGEAGGPGLPLPGEVPDLDAAALARTGTREVPSCETCHGGARDEALAPGPRLEGQHAPYLAAQLRLFRDGIRGGGPRWNLMAQAAEHLSDDEILALAAWYAARGGE